jgi:hypothetical protein
MRSILLASSVAALCLSAQPSVAQQSCPAGRLASGQCMSPKLAGLEQSMRERSIIFSQPKFSYSAPLAPPGFDALVHSQNPSFTYEMRHEFSGHHNP